MVFTYIVLRWSQEEIKEGVAPQANSHIVLAGIKTLISFYFFVCLTPKS